MKKKVTIIGSGPSALLLAAFLDTQKFSVTLYEKNKAAGRKFLVAGKGGFNLTHAEDITSFVKRYTPYTFLASALINFTNTHFIDWLHSINIPTYVGSSKRVYPVKGIKPIAVLQAVLGCLKAKGVVVKYNQLFSGWDENNNPVINNKSIEASYTIFCLGGKSWQITGSNGAWLDVFKAKNIEIAAFKASNCRYTIHWHTNFIDKHEGVPLKNIKITCGNATQKGEAIIAKNGIEGNAIYGLSPQLRQELDKSGKANIFIDFKPMLSTDQLISKIHGSARKNTTEILKKDIKLSSPQIELLKTYLPKDVYLSPNLLAPKIKVFKLEVTGTATLDESISTVGGVALNAVNNQFELKALNNQFCIGEMLDWDAPTGGYLIQACASMGVYLARYLNKLD